MRKYQFCPLCATKLDTGPEGVPVCPRGHFTQYDDVSVTANVVPIKDGRILLARRGIEPYKGTYDLIGGFIQRGETGPEAAKREALEETGAHFAIGELFGTYPDEYRTATQDKPTLCLVYFAEHISGHPAPADDVAGLEWHPLDRLPPEFGRDGFPVLKHFVEDLIAWHQSR